MVDSREANARESIRRRRECLRCGKRFTTYERVEKIDLKIVKKDELLEEYDRSKVRKGIMRAIEKRPVTVEQVEELIDDIESRLRARKSTQISSSDIGRMVLTRLKHLDKVAYMRFASVFLEFRDLKDFQDAIGDL